MKPDDDISLSRKQYLLACLAEEAGEVAYACMKALRFGLDDGYPGTDRTNEGDIAIEIAHIKAIASMLDLQAAKSEGELIHEKIGRVLHFMEYSEHKGIL